MYETAFNTIHKRLFEKYEIYHEQSISSERITHDDVTELIDNFKKQNIFTVERLGESVEGRDINLISFGKGETKILAWTQMHGDEPTATAAVFDILNFFSSNDEFNPLRESILSKVTLYIIPMLNPDGAESHQRENSLNIDINRDAVRSETPEAQILLNAAKKIKPDFGFNLHDQNSYYTAGRTDKTAAISLLAPPFDYDKSTNEARTNSMKVISHIFDVLSAFIPGQLARYNDDYEPRAFGDSFIKLGISSILIESGFIKGDENKSFIRKLNFVAMLSAFRSIAERQYDKIDLKRYSDIPENESLLFDLLLRNITINKSNNTYRIDIGINREKHFDKTTSTFYYKGKIEQTGDLSIYYGIEEHDFEGLSVELPGIDSRVYQLEEIEKLDIEKLHSNGIGFIKSNDSGITAEFVKFPINVITRTKPISLWLKSDEMANFVLFDKKKVRYIIVNGFLQEISKPENSIHNAWVFD